MVERRKPVIWLLAGAVAVTAGVLAGPAWGANHIALINVPSANT